MGGFLSGTRDGQRVDVGKDGLLMGSDYYLRLTDDEYPIVVSFAHFKFPHRNLPPYWTSEALRIPRSNHQFRQTDLSDTLLMRDRSCTEAAHLIPRVEERWFRSNEMLKYTSRPLPSVTSTDDPRNAPLLRSDLHSTFDAKRWVVVPKAGTWVVHVLDPGPSRQFLSLYYNVTFNIKELTGEQWTRLFPLRTKSRSQSPTKGHWQEAAEEDLNEEEEEPEPRGRMRRRIEAVQGQVWKNLVSQKEDNSYSKSLERLGHPARVWIWSS
ncbi:hypothetical protein P152DRAFT_504981 [Eremomyces bilateralis CBS 781.70]|uniref:HNH nuclease domain-containing protein n=1 Tax=Eremomyces bilateralis CBS 781.70 TaxID=1392243 RepID=A0A6G1GDT3_9PEZI|nr:uncharacterized protein P152DRAFT_504981 [Eremomyces bilateralis CBS 781.70]KAF1816275.1 hypothetical protein P152DRAFT_504981 [Eremomyces bilateralis CBS 781.70]